MPCTCAIADCKNTTRNSNLSFYTFPKDKILQKSWIIKCKRKDKVNPNSARVCEVHFKLEDYERDLQNELLGLPLRKRLKSATIPSVFPDRGEVEENHERNQRVIRRSNHKLANEIVENFDLNLAVDNESVDAAQNIPINPSVEADIDVLKTSNSKLRNVAKRLRIKVRKLKRVIESLRYRLKVPRDRPKGLKTKIFSDSQVKKAYGQRRVNWSTPDIVKALSVRSVSLKAYETARKEWKLPLPASRTLRNWVHKFQCAPGILTDIIHILGERSSSLGKWSKICGISYDEMSVDSRFVLDPIYDKITSNSKVQVVMARGIVENWKQPIYYGFDTPMTAQLLMTIIKCLEDVGYWVMSVTSDLGGENRGVWKALGISTEKSWFPNPCDNQRNVYMFADMPHLLKLIRNHILDDGFIMQDGTILDKNVFETVIECDNSELKLCPKLNHSHVEVTGPERMRVRPAVQLLSSHTAALSKIMYADAPEITNFIQTINDGFDIFNSRCPGDQNNPATSAFGTCLENQLPVLYKLRKYMETIRFFIKHKEHEARREKSCQLPCQNGYIVSIDSLIGLYDYLNKEFRLEYLLTSRLTQDCLESLFSRVRGFGGPNMNPTPIEFRYRLRLILLGGSVRAPVGINSLQHCDSKYVSAELLDKNRICAVINSSELTPALLQPNDLNPSEPSESLTYLAGYIAWRLKNKYPSMPIFGLPTSQLREVIDAPESWLYMISRGGLLNPNSTMKDSILKCNGVFETFMKHYNGCSNLFKSLQANIKEQYPEICEEIITEFLKVRIKIRLKDLNCKRTSNTGNKKRKQFVNCRASKK